VKVAIVLLRHFCEGGLLLPPLAGSGELMAGAGQREAAGHQSSQEAEEDSLLIVDSLIDSIEREGP
jgi:hypothetical protein